ncbi:MAG: hypothetical protein K0Q51_155 [Rickettsiaceae bacterium]|jgi:hypothetical protein|nr:hypothetical protein [Rickettsiaceae bacterium]
MNNVKNDVYLPHLTDSPDKEYLNITGNLVPNALFKIITTKTGKPDHISINIISEIIYWYRPNKKSLSKFDGDAWHTSYDHFVNKFNYHRESIRLALVRLEKLNLIKREFRSITVRGKKYPNALFIHLNKQNEIFSLYLQKILGLSPKVIGDKYKEYKENNKNRYLDNEQSNFENISSNNFSEANANERSGLTDDCVILSETTVTDKNKQKTPNDLKKTFVLPNLNETTNLPIPSLPINCFLPLNEKDIDILAQRVGRDFGKTFINALAQKLNVKYPDRRFINKRVFLRYMEKALAHEKHLPERVNNTNFAYSCFEETYLEKIEAANDTSDVGLIKRRIVQEFAPKLATNILKKCYFRPVYKGCYNYSVYINDETLDLDEITMKKIESIIIEVTRRVDIANGETSGVGKVRFIQSNRDKGVVETSIKLEDNSQGSIEHDSNVDPIWARVRGKLREIYDPGADKSWFSRIRYSLYEGEGRVVLTFASEFRSEYVENNYGSRLNRILVSELPYIQEIVYEVENSHYSNIVWKSEQPSFRIKDKEKEADILPKTPVFAEHSFMGNISPCITM